MICSVKWDFIVKSCMRSWLYCVPSPLSHAGKINNGYFLKFFFLQSEPPSGRRWLGQLSVLLCAGHGSQSRDKIKQQGMGAQETGSIHFLSMAIQRWWRWGTQQIAWHRLCCLIPSLTHTTMTMNQEKKKKFSSIKTQKHVKITFSPSLL